MCVCVCVSICSGKVPFATPLQTQNVSWCTRCGTRSLMLRLLWVASLFFSDWTLLLWVVPVQVWSPSLDVTPAALIVAVGGACAGVESVF
jgi:hypothetical protein